jgi:hypothetical protein
MYKKATHMPPVENKLCDACERKKAPQARGFFYKSDKESGDFRHVRGLGAFLSLHDFEFNFVAFGEGFETRAANCAEMHEHVGASLARNEAKSLSVVEPFDRTSDACH